ncbi:Uncharacterised protein [Mycobacteroides abscessus subsp. abscessus]|uniref:Uncharacterized protein n=2 Tax=Mycobacteroides abscessus TaxID=36809 RepID=A0AB74FS88_9MYCO|nr:hypothetical protein AOY11_13510 [Mycobacteroides abscessus]EIC64565.1 hypothetical protein S7W_19688 [Mycobacteroides abscessus M94]EPZ22085.1 hypothetical protein M879_02565 [Mycobacteroides abscessus V06705]OLT70349.1 hypothetical protein BKG55_13700 [Mycobacteroides abscessus ATCC 19977]OLT92347.1 hypothetical protein BKG58_04120 [Mycobacteroides abscessus subsp. abscessus]
MGNICRALELAAEIEDLVAAETLDQFCLELLAQGGQFQNSRHRCPMPHPMLVIQSANDVRVVQTES